MRIKNVISTLMLMTALSFIITACSNDDEPYVNEYVDGYVDGIAYTVNIDNMTAEVVNNTTPSTYSGNVSLPSTVNINGKNFTVTSIGTAAFKGSSVTSINFPASITNIGHSAFMECGKLKSVSIPSTVQQIWGGAFSECKALTQLTIEDSSSPLNVGNEPTDAFFGSPIEKAYLGRECRIEFLIQPNNNSYLKYLTLGKNFTTVYRELFPTEPLTITCESNIPPEVGEYDYVDITNKSYMETIVYVPASAVETYKANEFWGKFWNIEPIK